MKKNIIGTILLIMIFCGVYYVFDFKEDKLLFNHNWETLFITLISFIFTIRTFIIFKIRDILLTDKQRYEDFIKFQQEGIISKNKEYFEDLYNLDKYFQYTTYELIIGLAIVIVLYFIPIECIQIKYWQSVVTSSCFGVALLTFCRAGIIISNIVKYTKPTEIK